MSQTCTYYGSDKESIKKWVKQCYRNTLSLEKPLEDKPSEDESRDKQKGIPPYLNWPHTKDHWTHIPMYC
jgi:hypothetical protein